MGEGVLEGPEDVCVDDEGTLYTATRDGWIKRMHPINGSWESWTLIGGPSLLGLAISTAGDLLVCDADMVRRFHIPDLTHLSRLEESYI